MRASKFSFIQELFTRFNPIFAFSFTLILILLFFSFWLEGGVVCVLASTSVGRFSATAGTSYSELSLSDSKSTILERTCSFLGSGSVLSALSGS